eukprot:jgi/Ulvmu1/10255/UM060_0056.1
MLKPGRLTPAPPADTSPENYRQLAHVALQAGLVPLLATNLGPSLRSRAAVGAVKASYIACNLAAHLPEAADEIIKLGPLLIAHVGLTYGPALCLQCAWAVGNLAAAAPAAATVLLCQGAVPTLLSVLDDAARTLLDTELASAGATCAWALSSIVHGTGTPKAANVLLSCTAPRFEAAVQRVLRPQRAEPILLLETAWLLAHALRAAAPGSVKLACREAIAHSALRSLAAAAAADTPDAAAAVAASRAEWHSAPPVLLEQAAPDACGNASPPLPNHDPHAAMDWAQAPAQHAAPAAGSSRAADTNAAAANGIAEAAAPLLQVAGALWPEMSPRQLRAALAADCGAGPRALLAVAQHGSAAHAAVALWALANLASTPLGAGVLNHLHAATVVLGVLRQAPTQRVRFEAATAICNLATATAAQRVPAAAQHTAQHAVWSALQHEAFLHTAVAMLRAPGPHAEAGSTAGGGAPGEPPPEHLGEGDADYCSAAENAVLLLHWHLPEGLAAFEQLAGQGVAQQVADKWRAAHSDADAEMS